MQLPLRATLIGLNTRHRRLMFCPTCSVPPYVLSIPPRRLISGCDLAALKLAVLQREYRLPGELSMGVTLLLKTVAPSLLQCRPSCMGKSRHYVGSVVAMT